MTLGVFDVDAGGGPSRPVTARGVVWSPGVVAVNDVVLVSVELSATPAGAVQAYPGMLPVELLASRVTFVPCTTVWSDPALATSGSGASAVPCLTSTGTVIAPPPCGDLIVTESGGAARAMSPAPVASSVVLNAGTVSAPAVADLSLLAAWTWTLPAVASYETEPVRRSLTGTALTVCGVPPRLTTSTFFGSAPVMSRCAK